MLTGWVRQNSVHSRVKKALNQFTSNPRENAATQGDPRRASVLISEFSVLQRSPTQPACDSLTGWVRNSLLSRVRTALNSGAIREKKQRLDRWSAWSTRLIGEFYLLQTTPTQPVRAVTILTGWVGILWSTKNPLMNTEASVDHLESLHFLADYS